MDGYIDGPDLFSRVVIDDQCACTPTHWIC